MTQHRILWLLIDIRLSYDGDAKNKKPTIWLPFQLARPSSRGMRRVNPSAMRFIRVQKQTVRFKNVQRLTGVLWLFTRSGDGNTWFSTMETRARSYRSRIKYYFYDIRRRDALAVPTVTRVTVRLSRTHVPVITHSIYVTRIYPANVPQRTYTIYHVYYYRCCTYSELISVIVSTRRTCVLVGKI